MQDYGHDNYNAVQTKTFTKWVNSRLKKADLPIVDNFFMDIGDGVAIINLLGALGIEISNFNKKPIARIQKIENISIVLEYLKKINVPLVNIGPADIVDGNEKLILGFIYTLILKFSISEDLSNEIFSLRDEILHWTKKVTEEYKKVSIENLTTSWQNGIAFNAIIHRFRPHLVENFFNLNPNNATENCDQAFKIAEEFLEIPKLFDSEDIVDVLKPDEKSILTYLSQFYQKFKQEEIMAVLKSDLNNFIENYDKTLVLESFYENKAKKFIKDKEIFNEKVDNVLNSYKALLEIVKEVEIMNLNLISDSVDISGCLDKINFFRNQNNLKKYFSPSTLGIELIEISLSKPQFKIFNELKEIADEFDNKEAKIVENYKNITKSICMEENLDSKNNLIKDNIKEMTGIDFKSKIKKECYEQMKKVYNENNEIVKNYLNNKNKIEEALNVAKKLFNEKDYKQTGYISVSEFRKILRNLGLETNDYYQVFNGNTKITFDEMEGFIKSNIDRKLNRDNIKYLFEKLSLEGKYEVDKNKVYKGIGDKLADGCVSFEMLENEIVE